jgi:transcriptional regulator with XRE-family HTH domain
VVSDGKLTSYPELIQVLEALPILAREKRRAEGLSLRQAATQVGVSFSSMHRLENSKGDIRFDTILRVLRWLNRGRKY